MDLDCSGGNSCIRLLALMYLSIHRENIFGAGPPLQALAVNKCPTLNAVPSATETVQKAGSYTVLSFPEKNRCLISLSASIKMIKKTNKKNNVTNIN